MDMAELEEAKQTIEPQALAAQSKLRSLKTDLQVQSLHQRLSWQQLAPAGDHLEMVVRSSGQDALPHQAHQGACTGVRRQA